MFIIAWKLYPLHLCKPLKNWSDNVKWRNSVFSNSFRKYPSKKVWSPPSNQLSENYTRIMSYTYSGTAGAPRLKTQVFGYSQRTPQLGLILALPPDCPQGPHAKPLCSLWLHHRKHIKRGRSGPRLGRRLTAPHHTSNSLGV